MKLRRTYPQPDSDRPNIRPRERALAVFKYLLNLEPEAAVNHELFTVIVHSYEQERTRGWNEGVLAQAVAGRDGSVLPSVGLSPPLVAELDSVSDPIKVSFKPKAP